MSLTPEIITLMILAISVLFISLQLVNMATHMRSLIEDSQRLKKEIHESREEMREGFEWVKIEFLTIQADMLRTIKTVEISDFKSSAPSNRKARTDEQKALASKQRTDWWAKKRQEQKNSAPDDVTISPPPQ